MKVACWCREGLQAAAEHPQRCCRPAEAPARPPARSPVLAGPPARLEGADAAVGHLQCHRGLAHNERVLFAGQRNRGQVWGTKRCETACRRAGRALGAAAALPALLSQPASASVPGAAAHLHDNDVLEGASGGLDEAFGDVGVAAGCLRGRGAVAGQGGGQRRAGGGTTERRCRANAPEALYVTLFNSHRQPLSTTAAAAAHLCRPHRRDREQRQEGEG